MFRPAFLSCFLFAIELPLEGDSFWLYSFFRMTSPTTINFTPSNRIYKVLLYPIEYDNTYQEDKPGDDGRIGKTLKRKSAFSQ